MVVFYII